MLKHLTKKLALRPGRQFNKPAAIVVSLLVAATGTYLLFNSRAAVITYPTTPPAQVCGNASILDGPSSAPAGAITVNPGQNLNDVTQANPAGTTFYLAAGTHTLGTGEFGQVLPKAGNIYIGAPGAILDGQNVNRYAFNGWPNITGVTIKHLTVRNFKPPMNEGVVNPGSFGTGWTVERNTITLNGGAGVFVGDDNKILYNCLKDNGQYGFSMYKAQVDGASAINNILLDHNEISGNNTGDWESIIPGCGCTGGGKFWDVKGATITNNWVHHNKGTALWADTNNIDFLFEGNYIEENDGIGIWYEISYNFMIRNNTFKRNGLLRGQLNQTNNDPFPIGAVYIAESGSDSRVSSNFPDSEITGNNFEDNWDGVVLWEAAERFCGSPANTSAGYCTKTGAGATSAAAGFAVCKSGHFFDGVSTSGSKTYSSAMAHFSPMDDGASLSSPNIPAGTTIASGSWGDALNVTLSNNATASGTGLEFLIGGRSATNQINQEPHTTDCRWRTREVKVHTNIFTVTSKAAIGCTGDLCARNAVFSNWGTAYPKWGPVAYQSTAIQEAITFTRGNVFSNNTYTGPWRMTPYHMGNRFDFATWQAAPYNQDAGSTCTDCATGSTGGGGGGGGGGAPISYDGNHLDSDTQTIEGSTGRWSTWYSTAISRSTSAAQTGSASLKVDINASGGWGVTLNNYPGFYADPGDKRISFWGLLGSGNNLGATLKVKWRDSTDADIQTDTIAIPALSGTWQQATADVTAPAGTARVYLELTSTTGAAGNYIYIDEVYVGDNDTTPPTISAITAGTPTTTAATINWTTNEPADSQVEYGTTTAYGTTTTLDSSLATSHTVQLASLTPGTLYHYRVKSRDAAGNLATSADQTFTTATEGVTPPPTKKGDVNGDGKVDIFDLSILLNNYAKTTSTGDLNGDGKVDVLDLSILLSNYGT